MHAEFALSGFSVKQNILSLALNRFLLMGFHHFLTGDANWEDLQQYGNSSDHVGVNLGPLSLGGSSDGGYVKATRSSFVSRNQVKQAVETSTEALTGAEWVEIKSNQASLETLQKQMIDDLLSRASTVDVAFDSQNKSLVATDPNIQMDLTPDQITKLGNWVKNKWEAKNDRKVTVKGVPVEVNTETKDDEDITWQREGTAIIPKSVRLYRFSNSSFSKLVTRQFIYTEASKAKMRLEEDGLIGRRIEVPAKTVNQHVHLALFKIPIAHIGGDNDVDSGGHGTTVQFRTTTHVEADKVRIECFYRVKEEVEDYTEFRETVPFEYKKPADVDDNGTRKPVIRIDRIVGTPGDVNFNRTTNDELRDLDIPTSGTVVSSMKLHVDSGDDDNTVVGFDGFADFDVVLQLSPPSYRIEWQ